MKKLRIKDVQLDYYLNFYGCLDVEELEKCIATNRKRKLVIVNTERRTKRRLAVWNVVSKVLIPPFALMYYAGCIINVTARFLIGVSYLLTTQGDKAKRVFKSVFTTNPFTYPI